MTKSILVVGILTGFFISGTAVVFAQTTPTGTWEIVGAPINIPGPHDWDYAAGLNNSIFFANSDNSGYQQHFISYDLTTNAYAEKSLAGNDLCACGFNSLLTAANSKLYYIANSGTVYNPQTDVWSPTSYFPNPRGEAGVGVLGNNIYYIGGRDTQNAPTNTAQVYDTTTNSWRAIANYLYPTEGWSAVTSYDNKIYVLGGEDANYAAINKMSVYDPATDSWTALSDIPFANLTARPRALTYGDKIYLFSYDNIYVYDLITASWENSAISIPSYFDVYYDVFPVLANNSMYLIGYSSSNSGYAIAKYTPPGTGTPAPTLSIPTFYQNITNSPSDPNWPSEYLGYSNADTIGSYGCAMTSAAMVLDYYGANARPDTGESINPHSLNQWLQKVGGYLPSTDSLSWNALSQFSNKVSFYADNKTFSCTAGNLSDCVGAMNTDLVQSRPVIVHTIMTNRNINHYVVAKGQIDNTWYINDPNHSINANKLSVYPYNNTVLGLRRFQPVAATSFSSMHITMHSPADLLITDSQGRRTGYDPATQMNYDEIPNSIYYTDQLDNEDTGEPGEPIKDLYIGAPATSTYNIQVIGTGTGEYGLSIDSSDSSGSSMVKSFTGQTQPNLVAGYSVSYTGQAGQSAVVAPTDTIAPTTTVALSGTIGSNNWFTSDVTVTLSAQDNPRGVGVFKTEYSLDGGQNWQTYTSPFTISTEGVSTLLYRSQDFVGDVEQTKSQEIKIDKTPPQLQLTADPNTLWPPNHKMINVTIGGSASDLISGIASTSFSVTDEYGKVQPNISNFGDVIQLEAWRNGDDLDGRLYTIYATATDGAGNQASTSTTVISPHDQSK